ncbi:CO-induced hydrogenase subunit K [Pyrococcus furiosus DSM 3638]|uniref:Mbh13 NADH dehydrogenase subunit (Like HycD, CooK, echB) n=3 Tax=Pyrococcus furiosus TaxID=2261 RepID=Q8U0Z5_PYRFU|nr:MULTISPECIES: respiratory chain complex I subunit 1 family protein [Pyrococcus]6CFW_M Chain M, Mbh13 NADH dehydrogenase subunit [Pyrococcus furiosus COM1]AAL81559.1 mbh13 NADH dehydrogenase subunit (like HycD, CooK, echB) [Pyrococcus furiosus DSM 3638]AFN04216.1 mbh13 NADH dehydrogenase subunit [Pyrococcus furiosus COM1]MDK2869518.1 formate hydrogenlyase subunit 4 [Pyrococcus sp.]QEK79064.1 CO-induced hydrogenase subunit K [Pyrococcus furiosus DSM 3638]
MKIVYGVIGLILIYIYVSVVSLLFSGIDRKLVARMQRRIGPPILQPFYDFLKLMSKETIIPKTANFMFKAAPILMLATVIALLAYTPLGFPPIFGTKGDIIVFIYLLTLADFFLVVGVMSSGSPYGRIGAARGIALLVSREPAMMLGVFAVMWAISKLGVEKPFSLSSLYEHTIWDFGPVAWVAGVVLIYVFMAWLASEIEVGFFNIPEAEQEIAEGTLVEYSGRYLGIIKLAESIKEFIAASLVVAVLFPWQLNIPGVQGYLINLLLHTLKVFIVLLVSKTIFRTITGRLKISQAVNLLWTRVFTASVIGALLLALGVML